MAAAKLSKLDEEKIKRQAKAIMDEFVKALDKVGETASAEPMRRGSFAASISGEVGLEREETTREGAAKKSDKGFIERMLENAPRKEGSQILAEKKSW